MRGAAFARGIQALDQLADDGFKRVRLSLARGSKLTLEAELRTMERVCLEWAEDCDLDLARDGLEEMAIRYRAAADAISRTP